MHRDVAALDALEFGFDAFLARVEHHRRALTEHELFDFDETEHAPMRYLAGEDLVDLALVDEHDFVDVARGHAERSESGGEGEIRTHVPGLTDHPISSRRRYDHFGTSPEPAILTDMNPRGTVTTPLLIILGALFLILTGCGGWRTGALEDIRSRGELRVAMFNSPTTYYLGLEGPEGAEYELVSRFAAQLGVKLTVVVVADRAELRDAIMNRRADIAASRLSWSSQWRGVALPSEVYAESPLFWVYRRGQPRPKTTTQLKELNAVVLEDSAAWNYLQSLSALERAAYELTELPKNLGRDPLDIVASGRAEVTLIDGFEYANLRSRYPSLDVAFGIDARRPLYWMVRKDGRDLLTEVNRFLLEQRAKKRIPNPAAEIDPSTLPDTYADQLLVDLEVKLPLYRKLFESASAETNLDWSLIAALGYQESQWNPKARSPFGAQGLMMLMPRTARSLGVTDPYDAAQSILAGARYLAQLRETIPARIREPDRTWMAVAAYNMGYGHLEDARVLTARQGGNADRWIDVRERLTLLSDEFWYLQVKNGYARGWETRLLVDRVQQYLEIIEDREISLTASAEKIRQ